MRRRVTLGGPSSVPGGPEMALARVALGGLDPVPKLICHPERRLSERPQPIRPCGGRLVPVLLRALGARAVT